MTLPTPYRLRVRDWTEGDADPDDFGNATGAWVERDWLVHGIAPGSMSEPGESNRDLSLVAWTVYGPVAGAPSGSSEVRLPGESKWLQVDGLPADWSKGPWAHPTAGVVVELRRADG